MGRADLLCALFFQLSFLTYCKAFNGGRYLTQVLLFILLSITLILIVKLYCTNYCPYELINIVPGTNIVELLVFFFNVSF